MSDEIQGLDPLMSGQVMYSSERPAGAPVDEPVADMPSEVPTRPASKVANRSRAQQDKVAEGRVEKAGS